MATTEFIAAIELGSSQMAGIAGKKESDGSLRVMATACEEAAAFVHKGVIYNIDKAAAALSTVVRRLEEQLHASIGQVYAGIGGQSLHSLKSSVSRDVGPEEGTVSQALVDALYDENRETPLADLCILDVAPQEYKVDHSLQADPVGATGSHLTGQYLNLVARTSLRKNLEMAFAQASIRMADDPVVSALTTARALLSPSEMRSGCALVDMGSDTTTVSVYKGGLLRHLCVLPLGGRNITRDLTFLQVEEEEAELLKCRYGDAYYEEDETTEHPACCLAADGRSIRLSDLNDIVGARAEELLANVLQQVRESGYDGQLFAGTVFTGGASTLKNLEEAWRKLHPQHDKVKTVRKPVFAVQGLSEEELEGGRWCGALGLLYAGRQHCGVPEPPKEVPPTRPEAPMQTPTTPRPQAAAESADMFADDADYRQQIEEGRIRKEKENSVKQAQQGGHKTDTRKPQSPKPPRLGRFATLFKNLTDEFLDDNSDKI